MKREAAAPMVQPGPHLNRRAPSTPWASLRASGGTSMLGPSRSRATRPNQRDRPRLRHRGLLNRSAFLARPAGPRVVRYGRGRAGSRSRVSVFGSPACIPLSHSSAAFGTSSTRAAINVEGEPSTSRRPLQVPTVARYGCCGVTSGKAFVCTRFGDGAVLRRRRRPGRGRKSNSDLAARYKRPRAAYRPTSAGREPDRHDVPTRHHNAAPRSPTQAVGFPHHGTIIADFCTLDKSRPRSFI
jgi:hypothetical protein